MTTTATKAKRTTARKGAKTKGTRNAGKTARKAPELTWHTLPRSPRQLAVLIHDRLKRSPNYWRETNAHLDAMDRETPTRAAQLMPRTNAPEPMH